MDTVPNQPYAVFEDGEMKPVLGYEEEKIRPLEKIPMVYRDGKVVPARRVGDFEISINPPEEKEDCREILHG